MGREWGLTCRPLMISDGVRHFIIMVWWNEDNSGSAISGHRFIRRFIRLDGEDQKDHQDQQDQQDHQDQSWLVILQSRLDNSG